ncbi:MAG: GFA family protein [Neisseria sp.]|nr:GFA family protein [Neisseria sp.]
MDETLNGGCLCGAIRYRVTVKPVDAGYCHCRVCQQASGAPSVAWASVPRAAFAYTAGAPKIFSSSSAGRREFCPQCGTQLVFYSTEHPQWLDVTVASLDQPQACPPAYHIWTDSKIPWLATDDQLPQFADGGPDGQA